MEIGLGERVMVGEGKGKEVEGLGSLVLEERVVVGEG